MKPTSISLKDQARVNKRDKLKSFAERREFRVTRISGIVGAVIDRGQAMSDLATNTRSGTSVVDAKTRIASKIFGRWTKGAHQVATRFGNSVGIPRVANICLLTQAPIPTTGIEHFCSNMYRT